MFSIRNIILALLMLLALSQAPKGIKLFGEAYTDLWEKVLELFGNEPIYLFTIGTTTTFVLPFWLLVLCFIFLDLWGKPEFLLAYKVQADKNVPVTWETYKTAFKVVNINQLIATVLVVAIYPITRWRDIPFSKEDLPSFSEFILHIIYFSIAEEIAFYYLHRLMHHPLFYKRIHKLHHEWTAPIAMATVYVHPFEHIVVNAIPILFSPLLIGAHLSTMWIWNISAITVSTIHHSGYHFPFFPSPEFHDFHHLKFNQCFGVLGVLDWFHQADKLYRKSENFKHNRLLLSLKPIERTT